MYRDVKIALYCILAIVLIIVIAENQQMGKIERQEIVLHKIDKGIYAGNPAHFDTVDNVITIKTPSYPIRMWENEEGQVMVKRYVFKFRAPHQVVMPANEVEILFYRSYFAEEVHFPKNK